MEWGENSLEGRAWVCGTKGQEFKSLFSPLIIYGSYGLGVKTLGFQLKDRSSSLFRSVGRVILFICF